MFIAIAVTLHVLETLLPSPVPWLRLGLANIMTLAALYLYGGRAAWTVSLARVGVGALLLGRLFSPGFWLAAAGAIVATSAMIIVYRVAGRRLSPIGVSAIGAAGHALGQILAARLLVIQHAAIWQIFPLFLLFTIFSGILTGWLAAGLLEQLRQHPAFQPVADAEDSKAAEG
jgi:heptaprenyl diphosphate synthase